MATGLLASEQRLTHMGIRYHPRRRTISDAINRSHADVFAGIDNNLYNRDVSFLSESRKNPEIQNFTFLIQLLFLYFRMSC